MKSFQSNFIFQVFYINFNFFYAILRSFKVLLLISLKFCIKVYILGFLIWVFFIYVFNLFFSPLQKKNSMNFF
jgi:hypothetical protein